MSKSIQDKARDQALTDWRNRSPVCWVCGRLDPNKPALAEGRIFYPSFCFIQTSEDDEFYNTYNLTISKLIEQHGIPDWAPIKRIPERVAVLEILTEASHSLLTLEYNSIREKNLVSSVLSKWKGGHPIVWSRLPDESLLLLGGNITEKAGRVDVLDTKNLRWLSTFEFLRKHQPNLPWDDYASLT